MRMRTLCLIFFIIGLTGVVPPGAFAYTSEECVRCHRESGTGGGAARVSVTAYQQSVHGRTGVGCTDCHKTIQGEDHEHGAGSAAVSCTECHMKDNRHGIGSGSDGRPECYSCHTKHNIQEPGDPGSSVNAASLKQTCATCHPAECEKAGALSWLISWQVASHGKGDFNGVYARDNCIGCHQGAAIHGEKEPIDGQNCAKCHGALAGAVHPKADPVKQPGVFASAALQQVALLMLLGAGVVSWVQWLSGATRKGKRKEPHDHRA